MSRRYKTVKNGKGTNLTIGPDEYISIGPKGLDVTIRGNGKVVAFDEWDDLVDAIDIEKAAYFCKDIQKGGEKNEAGLHKGAYGESNCARDSVRVQ